MTERVEVVVYVAINEKGSFISCERSEDALTLLMENHGGKFARIVAFHTMVEPACADEATADMNLNLIAAPPHPAAVHLATMKDES